MNNFGKKKFRENSGIFLLKTEGKIFKQ